MDRDFSTGYGKDEETTTGPLRSRVAGAAAEAKDQLKDQARAGLEESRRAVGDVLQDVQAKGKRLAEKAREWGSDAKKSTLEAARDLKRKTEARPAVVALAALVVGVLIGRYLLPSSD